VTPVRVGVAGLGLIGGSIAQGLARESSSYSLTGFDADAATRAAASEGGIALVHSLEELSAGAELVVVAVPPEHTADAVTRVLVADAHVLVTDVASVKAPVVSRVRAGAPAHIHRYLPSHPLAGAESRGWESARPDLLDETVWAVCPPDTGAPAELLCRFGTLLDCFDARVIVCDAVEHDVAVARTSHAPHLAAEMIAASLEQGQASLAAALSGGAFRDMTRVARSDPALWSEILQLNREDVLAVVDEWIADLELLRASLAAGQDGAIGESWERGRAMVELVERLRWQAPAWEERDFDWPAWEELLSLGRAGVAIRRPSVSAGRLSAQVAVTPA
jgi:prephenate dehydrogenase